MVYIDNKLVGICTLGMIPCATEYVKWRDLKIDILELNRLFTIDGLPPNTLSKFVSKVFKLLKKDGEFILISYSDIDQHHNGIIYQATSWYYTGIGAKGDGDIILNNGKKLHGKWRQKYKNDIKEILKNTGKHRYYKIIGSKTFKKKVKKILYNMHNILPYPKGENIKYDIGKVTTNFSINKWIK